MRGRVVLLDILYKVTYWVIEACGISYANPVAQIEALQMR